MSDPHWDESLISHAVESPIAELSGLLEESLREGWRHIRRLADEWEQGRNRFDRAGECLLIARVNGETAGVCGLNVDPYATCHGVGRVRRLYVMRAFRTRGVGGRLVAKVVSAATDTFHTLQVRTTNSVASRLYLRQGFQPVTDDPLCTHRKDLRSGRKYV